MKIVIPPDTAKTVISGILRKNGGLQAMMVGNVPAIVDDWSARGVGLWVEMDSEMGQSLVSQGLVKAPEK